MIHHVDDTDYNSDGLDDDDDEDDNHNDDAGSNRSAGYTHQQSMMPML